MEAATRWWEFYFVRYAIGTLVGALVVNQAFRIDPRFRELMLFGIERGDLTERLFLLLGYGLLFCYIASIPILVIHAARLVVTVKPSMTLSSASSDQQSKWRRVQEIARELKFPIYVGVSFLTAQGLIEVYLAFAQGANSSGFLMPMILWAVILIVCGEWIALIGLLFYGDRAYKGLKKLAQARMNNENAGGMMDSYKHLREHGNSILIVLLELVLGSALIGALNLMKSTPGTTAYVTELVAALLPLVLLWIAPGAGIWLVATMLERRFAFDRTPSLRKNAPCE